MDKYVIKGGNRLTGEVNISGAKNAAVAIIPAVILADAPCRLENLPDISDVKTLLYIMDSMGARVDYLDRHTVEIDPRPVSTDTVDADVARRIRASYYFLGALLGTAACYGFGTLWMMLALNMSLIEALLAGVVPFLPFDLIKIAVAVAAVLPVRWASYIAVAVFLVLFGAYGDMYSVVPFIYGNF